MPLAGYRDLPLSVGVVRGVLLRTETRTAFLLFSTVEIFSSLFGFPLLRFAPNSQKQKIRLRIFVYVRTKYVRYQKKGGSHPKISTTQPVQTRQTDRDIYLEVWDLKTPLSLSLAGHDNKAERRINSVTASNAIYANL